jgi:hypothetical protein
MPTPLKVSAIRTFRCSSILHIALIWLLYFTSDQKVNKVVHECLSLNQKLFFAGHTEACGSLDRVEKDGDHVEI